MCKFTLKKLNAFAVISNFLAFFLFLYDKFSLLDPCGSGSTALNVPVLAQALVDAGFFGGDKGMANASDSSVTQ